MIPHFIQQSAVPKEPTAAEKVKEEIERAEERVNAIIAEGRGRGRDKREEEDALMTSAQEGGVP